MKLPLFTLAVVTTTLFSSFETTSATSIRKPSKIVKPIKPVNSVDVPRYSLCEDYDFDECLGPICEWKWALDTCADRYSNIGVEKPSSFETPATKSKLAATKPVQPIKPVVKLESCSKFHFQSDCQHNNHCAWSYIEESCLDKFRFEETLFDSEFVDFEFDSSSLDVSAFEDEQDCKQELPPIFGSSGTLCWLLPRSECKLPACEWSWNLDECDYPYFYSLQSSTPGKQPEVLIDDLLDQADEILG